MKEQFSELNLEEEFLISFFSTLTPLGSLGLGISLENDLQESSNLIKDLSPSKADQEALKRTLEILKKKNRLTTLEILAAIATTKIICQRNIQPYYTREALIEILVDLKIRTLPQALADTNLETLSKVLKATESVRLRSSDFLFSVIVLATAGKYCQQTSLLPEDTLIEPFQLLNTFFDSGTPFNLQLRRVESNACREFVENFSISGIQQKFLSRVVAEQERQTIPFIQLDQPIETFDDLVQIQSFALQ